jgi:hypothetical protein
MKFSSEKLEGLLKDLDVDENIILKPILQKYNIKVWIGMNLLGKNIISLVSTGYRGEKLLECDLPFQSTSTM